MPTVPPRWLAWLSRHCTFSQLPALVEVFGAVETRGLCAASLRAVYTSGAFLSPFCPVCFCLSPPSPHRCMCFAFVSASVFFAELVVCLCSTCSSVSLVASSWCMLIREIRNCTRMSTSSSWTRAHARRGRIYHSSHGCAATHTAPHESHVGCAQPRDGKARVAPPTLQPAAQP